MRHTRIGLSAVILALGILAAACGSSGGNVSTTNPGSNSGTTGTTRPAPTTSTTGSHPAGWG